MISTAILTFVAAVTLSDLPYSYETYSILDSDTLEVGATIKPQSGWKWNTKYPSRFKVRVGNMEETGWQTFTNGAMSASLSSKHKIKNVVIVASFSVCNDTACKVFKDQELRFDSKNALKPCITCHGKDLNGKKKTPAIRGLSFEDLYASMTTIVPDKMKKVSSRLTVQEKTAISKYISKLEKP